MPAITSSIGSDDTDDRKQDVESGSATRVAQSAQERRTSHGSPGSLFFGMRVQRHALARALLERNDALCGDTAPAAQPSIVFVNSSSGSSRHETRTALDVEYDCMAHSYYVGRRIDVFSDSFEHAPVAIDVNRVAETEATLAGLLGTCTPCMFYFF